jgi:hypothetical protein
MLGEGDRLILPRVASLLARGRFPLVPGTQSQKLGLPRVAREQTRSNDAELRLLAAVPCRDPRSLQAPSRP